MSSALRSRAARAALAVPALLLVLAACGGAEITPLAGESASETPPSTASAPEASESPSEATDDEGDAATASGGSRDSAAGKGSWDEKTLVPAMKAAIEEQETAHVSMTTTSGGMSMGAEGDLAFRGDQQDMTLTMDGAALGTGNIEMRMVDRVLYLSMPPMTPQGKFVEIRPGDTSSPFAGMTGKLQGVDPRDTFKAFEQGLRRVAFVGEESVHGEDLEHYRLTVDLRGAAKAQGMPRSAGMPRTVVYDLWLDGDALMRRVEFDMQQQVSMVMEMSDWGERVDIEAPRPGQIVEPPGQ